MENVESFYNQLSSRYTELISRCIPRYEEIFYNLFYYIPDDIEPQHILDLGCGTGNLTEAALKYYPGAHIHALDISADILNECKQRFPKKRNVHFHKQDFTQLDFEDESFDLVISSIAIHHIDNNAKAALYQNIYNILKPGGVFVFADQTSGITEEIYQKHIGRWKEEAFKLGSTEADWKLWMKHQDAHDHHAPVTWHLGQLEATGFEETDVIWKNIMWAIIQCRK